MHTYIHTHTHIHTYTHTYTYYCIIIITIIIIIIIIRYGALSPRQQREDAVMPHRPAQILKSTPCRMYSLPIECVLYTMIDMVFERHKFSKVPFTVRLFGLIIIFIIN